MFGRWLEALRLRTPGVYRHLSKPTTIPLLIVGMCGITAFLRRFFPQGETMSKRRSVEGNSEDTEPLQKKPATRQSVSEQAIEELAEHKSLKDFGYEFNKDGELRNIKTGAGFDFKVKEDQKYNQKRYEMIGELITEHVYDLLETEGKLKRLHVPVDAEEGDPTSFIFVSEDYQTNKDKLLILIHGSGVVRAGQWARRLIINNNLACGTQLPYISRAQQEGYAVVVLNTNLNKVEVNGKSVGICHNTRPEEHGKYVWEHVIRNLPAKNVAIVAHSYGGIVTTHIAKEFADEVCERVFAIAFTDSVHSLAWQQAPDKVHSLFVTRARNWVSSADPVDTPVSSSDKDAPCVSAGHDTHEWTSWTALESIFRFFSEKLPGAEATPVEEKKEAPAEKAGEKGEEL